MSKSLFGSIKNKLSRGDSDKTIENGASRDSLALHSSNPFAGSGPPISGSQIKSRIAVPERRVAWMDRYGAPPAYTPVAPSLAESAAPHLHNITSDDDKYAFLSSFDTVFVVDDSGSMAGSPWREVAAVLRSITPICAAHDSDGIDLYFLNHRSAMQAPGGKAKDGYYNINSPGAMEAVFNSVRPCGTTPTGTRLQSILRPYLASLSSAKDVDDVKPVNIIVITDGCPTDDPESVIVQSAMKLDRLEAPPHQIGIQFFQVGNDKDATEALRELDDDLADQGVRDIVDTVTWDGTASNSTGVLSADGILKVVLGAVVRRLDRKPAGKPSRDSSKRR
ncbi:hypothetical protein Trco_000294 [Trichoderma cornu-damae]|uniref:VWFA domain-containing protein n=1 Tax=Trichoderma cornu-damae TaxID=654480 RepID=A0A9P8QS35_9HYPO|nr:hypothetical protein Trco_000294 [Trichoderma cornu-damae]